MDAVVTELGGLAGADPVQGLHRQQSEPVGDLFGGDGEDAARAGDLGGGGGRDGDCGPDADPDDDLKVRGCVAVETSWFRSSRRVRLNRPYEPKPKGFLAFTAIATSLTSAEDLPSETTS